MQVVRENGSVVAIVDPRKSSVETWLTCSVRTWLQLREDNDDPSDAQLRAAAARIPQEFGQGSSEVWWPHDPRLQLASSGAPVAPIWRTDDKDFQAERSGKPDTQGSSELRGGPIWIGAGFRVVEAQYEERSGDRCVPWAPTITLSLEARVTQSQLLRSLDFCDRYGQLNNFIEEIGRVGSPVN
jgi:hypothetical protein